MPIDGNNDQSLGFIELNGPELCEIVGEKYGKPLIYVDFIHLIDIRSRNTFGMSGELSQYDPPDESNRQREKSKFLFWA
jgi:hypothetical protein